MSAVSAEAMDILENPSIVVLQTGLRSILKFETTELTIRPDQEQRVPVSFAIIRENGSCQIAVNRIVGIDSLVSIT